MKRAFLLSALNSSGGLGLLLILVCCTFVPAEAQLAHEGPVHGNKNVHIYSSNQRRLLELGTGDNSSIF